MDDEAVRFVHEQQLSELEYQGYVLSLSSSLKGVLAEKMVAEHRVIARSNVAVRAVFADYDSTLPHPISRLRLDRWIRNQVSSVLKGAGHAIIYIHAREIMNEIDEIL